VTAKFQGDLEKTTVAEVRKWLSRVITEQGGVCPCCQRDAVVRKRSFNQAMAYALKVFAKNFKVGAWVNVTKFIAEHEEYQCMAKVRDWTRMQFWGLIEPKRGSDEQGKKAGVYRLTLHGLNFAEGRVRIPAFVCMYNERVLKAGMADVQISIDEIPNSVETSEHDTSEIDVDASKATPIGSVRFSHLGGVLKRVSVKLPAKRNGGWKYLMSAKRAQKLGIEDGQILDVVNGQAVIPDASEMPA